MFWHVLREGNEDGLQAIEEMLGLSDEMALPILVISEHLIITFAFIVHRFSSKVDTYTSEKFNAEENAQAIDKNRESSTSGN